MLVCGPSRLLPSFYRLSAVSPSDLVGFPLSRYLALPDLSLAMAETPALPAPGGDASAELALQNRGPEEAAIHSGDTTTEGDMSYVDEDFDPITRCDPCLSMPGVADHSIGFNQLNLASLTSIDARTANLAVVNQDLDPGFAEHLMSAQQQTIQNEANAFDTELLERQRDTLMSEARDRISFVENNAAQQLFHKNLQLNEQAAQAMNEMKTAQVHTESQDQRIKELNAELQQMKSSVFQLNNSFLQSASDLRMLPTTWHRTARSSWMH